MRISVAQAEAQCPEILAYFTEMTDVALRTQTELAQGIFMAEGELTIRRAFAQGYRLLAVMAESRWLDALGDIISDATCIEDDQARLSQVTGFVIHRGAMAAFERPVARTPEEVLASGPRILLLEGLVNHTNVGAIFRSAAAMRMSGILIGPECADPLYRRAIRTSMGAVFSLPWARVEWNSFVAMTASMDRVALTPAVDSLDIRQWKASGPCVLMVGAEGEGLTQRAIAAATVKLRIPMAAGIDSLNAAAATAVACFEITRGLP